MMTGHGTLNEWQACYATKTPDYLGYIQDSFGNRLEVPEAVALKICGMLNELIEALGDIADCYDVSRTAEARTMCEIAYDQLVWLNHIVPDESGYPK